MRFVLFLLALPLAGQQIDWVTQVRQKPVYDTRSFNWTPQAPGGSLTGGVQATINLTKGCPPGVTASTASNYWVVLTLPTEPMLVTGGTCKDGALTGSLIGTPTSSHSGAWTIGPNGNGLVEALQAASAGGTVLLQPQIYSIYAHPVVPSNVVLQGSGASSVIQVAANQWPASSSAPAWKGLGAATAIPIGITTPLGATNVVMRDFTIDMNGASQTNQTFGTSIALDGTSYSTLENIWILHAWHLGTMVGVHESTGTDNRVLNVHALGDGLSITNCASANHGPGGIFVQNTNFTVEDSYVTGTCDEGFISNGGALYGQWIGNHYVSGFASATNAPTAFHAEDASRHSFIGNTCRGFTGSCFNVAPTGVSGSNITHIIISNNLCGAASAGQYPNTCFSAFNDTSAHTSTQISITGNHAELGGVGSYGILANGSYLTIQGNVIEGAAVAGISFTTAQHNVIATNNVLTSNATNIQNTSNCSVYCTLAPNVTDDSGNQMVTGTVGTTLAITANTIAPTAYITHVGAGLLKTITPPVAFTGGCIQLLPDAAFTYDGTGNIVLPSGGGTATPGRTMTMCWDGNAWVPSY